MNIKKNILFFALILFFTQSILAQESKINKSSFDFINLNQMGLEKVKNLVDSAKYNEAAAELLRFYRNRSNVRHLDFNIDNKEKLANNILLHKFKPHKGYSTYDYGKDINWQYRPVKDQLLTTFLHRTAFWEPFI